MRKHLQIQVPFPCHENWDNMTPDTQGRFCMSCQKEVVDFTHMTDYELIQYFQHLKGNTCGRFTDDQLARSYTIQSGRRLNWIKCLIKILIPTLLLSAKGFSQTPKKKTTAHTTSINYRMKSPVTLGTSAVVVETTEIRGTILNNKDELLEGASIFIKASKEGVAADKNGAFVLSTKRALPLALVVTHAGYEPMELTVEDNFETQLLRITLNESTMDEVVVVSYPTISCRMVTGGFTVGYSYMDSVEPTRNTLDKLGFSPVKIYPNPLRKSSVMTIELKSKISGAYTVLLTDMNGRHIQSEQLNVESGTIRQQMRIKVVVAQGTYVVTVFDPNHKRASSQKVVVMD